MTGDYIRGYIVGMPFFARVFLNSNDPQALDLCMECIRVAAFSIPFYSVVYNFNNYLMAVKRLRFDTFYSFLHTPPKRERLVRRQDASDARVLWNS